MNIVVPIKQTLDLSGVTFRRDKERMFVNREEYVIDAASASALEAALRIKDAQEATVIATTMGPSRAEDALREALALGCDKAYLLSDPSFDQADLPATAHILASALFRLGGADLVVCGQKSQDTSAGQIGPRLAEALSYALLTDVYEISIHTSYVEATRWWNGRYVVVGAQLPAVIAVASRAYPARRPHGARIMRAYQEWTVTAWDAADLNLSSESLAPRQVARGTGFPQPQEKGELLQGDPQHIAREAVMTLRLNKLID